MENPNNINQNKKKLERIEKINHELVILVEKLKKAGLTLNFLKFEQGEMKYHKTEL